MKLILKNSTILFKNKTYQEVPINSTLNTPTSFYVDSDQVKAGAGGLGGSLYVNIYQVVAGTKYYIKTLPNGVSKNSASALSSVYITYGTNKLTGTGIISNAEVLKIVNVRDESEESFNVEFTPAQNGYIYITEVNMQEANLTKVLSSVFV